MPAHQYISGNRTGWLVDIMIEGERYQKRFPDDKYDNARKVAREYLRGLNQGLRPENRKGLRLKQQIHEYLVWAERTGKKQPSTIRTDNARLNQFHRWIEKKANSVADITITNIRKYQLWYLDPEINHYPHGQPIRGSRHATWEKHRLILSAFFNWCTSRHYMDNNIISGHEEFKSPPHRTKMLRYYTQDELDSLFDSFDTNLPRIRAAFLKTLAYTGLRLSELISLEWSAVDMRRKEIWVVGQTKSKKKRMIPINPSLQTILKSIKRKTKFVFDDGQDNPMLSGGRWFRILGKALKGCRIKGANLHTFRHTFASHLVMAGVDLRTVQELLGHSNITTTLIYAHLSPEHLKDTVSKLPY